jgi:hypothetical protein
MGIYFPLTAYFWCLVQEVIIFTIGAAAIVGVTVWALR